MKCQFHWGKNLTDLTYLRRFELAMLDLLQVHHLVGQWQGDGQDFTVQQAASPVGKITMELHGMAWSGW